MLEADDAAHDAAAGRRLVALVEVATVSRREATTCLA